jgi:hypothetical protein
MPDELRDDRELGKWKAEFGGMPALELALAGKKLYALRLADGSVKYSAKGFGLAEGAEWREMVRMAKEAAKLRTAEPMELISAAAKGETLTIPRAAPPHTPPATYSERSRTGSRGEYLRRIIRLLAGDY